MATRIAPTADVSQEAVIGQGTSIWHLAQVREHAVLGENCVVGRGAYIGEGVRMGANCKVQNYALVYEPAVLADGVFIGPAVTLTNDHFPRIDRARLVGGHDLGMYKQILDSYADAWEQYHTMMREKIGKIYYQNSHESMTTHIRLLMGSRR